VSRRHDECAAALAPRDVYARGYWFRLHADQTDEPEVSVTL